jgi:hypothetical protein
MLVSTSTHDLLIPFIALLVTLLIASVVLHLLQTVVQRPEKEARYSESYDQMLHRSKTLSLPEIKLLLVAISLSMIMQRLKVILILRGNKFSSISHIIKDRHYRGCTSENKRNDLT